MYDIGKANVNCHLRTIFLLGFWSTVREPYQSIGSPRAGEGPCMFADV